MRADMLSYAKVLQQTWNRHHLETATETRVYEEEKVVLFSTIYVC